MRSRRLEIALTVFVEEAAVALEELLAGGAEVPIEIVAQSSRRGQAPLYSYRPLTRSFIREHAEGLARLHTHSQVLTELAEFGGLERYLRPRVLTELPADGEGQARVALGFLLEDVFAEQTDFKLRRERLQEALELLDGTVAASTPNRVTIVATLHGVALHSTEVLIAPGLSITRPDAAHGLPDDIAGEDGGPREQLLVLYSSERADGRSTVAEGRDLLRELLRALRLFGDGRVTIGGLGWVRIAGGRWRGIALGTGGRPQGRLLITPEQEDALREFCGLLSRQTPFGGALAWALDRFEMGCERAAQVQALSDYVLALRMLLNSPGDAEPSAAAEELLARRLAVLCAAGNDRAELFKRTRRALALERSIGEHGRFTDVRQEALARELGEHLRMLLRDVVWGRLDSNLATVADAMLAQATATPETAATTAPANEQPASKPAPTSLSRARTTRQQVRSDQEQTLVRPSPRKARTAGSR